MCVRECECEQEGLSGRACTLAAKIMCGNVLGCDPEKPALQRSGRWNSLAAAIALNHQQKGGPGEPG